MWQGDEKKKTSSVLLVLVVVFGLILSGCSSRGVGASSWQGLAADDGSVYLSSGDSIMAINLSDGMMQWRYPEKPDKSKGFYADPVIVGDQLIVGDYVHLLHNINKKTGFESWTYSDAKGRWIASPLIFDEKIFAPCGDYFLYALDLNKNLLWKFESGQALWGKPVTDGKNIFVTSMDHYLYSLSPDNGKVIWKKDLGGAIVSGAAYSEGVLYVGTLANTLVAVNAENGDITWKYATKGGLWSTPVVVDTGIIFGDFSGTIYSLDKSGKSTWTFETTTPIIASGGATSDGIVFVNEGGEVVMINMAGSKVWSKTIAESKLYSTPLVTKDKILIAITEGKSLLMAYDYQGNEKWSFSAPK